MALRADLLYSTCWLHLYLGKGRTRPVLVKTVDSTMTDPSGPARIRGLFGPNLQPLQQRSVRFLREVVDSALPRRKITVA